MPVKPYLFILFFCFGFILSPAQNEDKIILGRIDNISSKILNEERKIWIYLPAGALQGKPNQERYPVLYLLDGDTHFYSVAGMIHQLSTANGNTVCPEMIVVGIPNTVRNRDLTPSRDSIWNKNSGGGEKFISFISEELIAYIDSVYPTEPYRMFVGHSLGGLLVMHTLVHHTALFNAYVVIDPSMWWHQRKLLMESREAMMTNTYPGTTLFLGIANTMRPGRDTAWVKSDTASSTNHIRSILELNKYLGLNTSNQFKYRSKYYPEDNHGSVPLITTYDALHFIFDFYPLRLSPEDFADTTTTMASKIEAHYDKLKLRLGYRAKPRESTLDFYGQDALRKKNFSKAVAFFKLNAQYFPNSYKVYDSLGDYFIAINQQEKAIDQYRKALSILQHPDTRAKLEKITKK